MKNVRAIILAVGGVVVRPGHTPERAAEWEALKGLSPGSVYKALWGEAWWQEYIVGRRSVDSYHRAVAEALHMHYPDEVMRFIESFYAGEALDDAVLALVARLRPRYRVGLLGNAGPEQQIQLLHKFGLDTRVAFDDHVISGVMGVATPSQVIFQLACERLGVACPETVMVDPMSENIHAVRALGMRGILYTNYAALLEALRHLGVEV